MVVGLILFCCLMQLIRQGDYGWSVFFALAMLWTFFGRTWRIPPRF
jgi:hypothetical protein